MKTKIIFFGSDQYGAKVLETLQKDPNIEIVKVVKEKSELEGLKNLEERPDLGVVASFGALISQEVINWPKKGLLNLHPSLLPKYRGSTPVPTAILNGDQQTGLTIIKVDEQIDHGPIVSQFKEAIKPEDTSESLLQRLFAAGAEVLITLLPLYLKGQIEMREQNHSQATYTQKLSRDDGQIDWQKPADYLERFVRAMFPWPGAWTEVSVRRETRDVRRLKILKAHLEPTTNHQSLITNLVLDQVQLEGKKPVSFKQFQEGYPEARIIK